MRTERGLSVSVIILLGCTLASCVSHSPVSELLIFHDPSTTPSSRNNTGFGMAVSMQPLNPARDYDAIEQLATVEQYHSDDPYNSNRLSAGFYAARFDDAGRFSIAGSFGFMVAGLDATAKVSGRNYVTAGVSAPGQLQASLMHRAYNSTGLGLATGIGYKRDVYAFPTSCYCYGPTESVSTIGGRAFFIYRPEGNAASGMKLGVYVGFAPEIDRAMVTLSLVTGRF